MRTNIEFIQHRMNLSADEAGTDIVLNWREFSGVITTDVNGSKLGTSAARTATVQGLIHFVQIGSNVVKQFNEIEAGDCIVDFPGDVAIDGKDSLRFIINGEQWELKPLSDRLAKMWDVIMRGERLHRSVLLRKA